MSESGDLLDLYMAEVRRLALNDAEQAPLWLAYKRRPTTQLRLRLWNSNLHKIARIVVKRFPAVSPTVLLDMIQDAAIEVLPYLERFRPEDGVPFGAYIHKPVLTYATRSYRRLASPVKFAHTHGNVEVPGAASLDEVAMLSHGGDSPEDEASGSELAEDIAAALARLGWVEQFVFRAALQPPRRSIEEIAEDTGLPRSRIQQALRRAMEAVPGAQERLATA